MIYFLYSIMKFIYLEIVIFQPLHIIYLRGYFLEYRVGFTFAVARHNDRSQDFLCDENVSDRNRSGNSLIFPTLVPAMAVAKREGDGLNNTLLRLNYFVCIS